MNAAQKKLQPLIDANVNAYEEHKKYGDGLSTKTYTTGYLSGMVEGTMAAFGMVSTLSILDFATLDQVPAVDDEAVSNAVVTYRYDPPIHLATLERKLLAELAGAV